jgi:hypothetical protein
MNRNMRFKFENLGALDVGELEIADLTVICGENNTGKTYLTYALYGLLKSLIEMIELPEIDLQPLRQSGILEIDLQSRILSKASTLIEGGVHNYRENLHRVLAAQEDRFTKTILQLDYDLSTVLHAEYRSRFNTDRNRRILEFVKPEGSSILTVSSATEADNERISNFRYRPLIDRIIKEICFARALPRPFIVSTERTGAITFQGELNLAKNRLIDLASEARGDEILNPTKLLEKVYGGGYPAPVKDNVDFINSLASVQSGESPLLKEHPEILAGFDELIGGSYRLQNEVLHFVPQGTRGVRLRMGESSSSVRSLVLLGYYLKHVARSGDLLMIDEPELNLHPRNQRRLARLIARLVQAGIKVFVTTHSDYIVKEFNTLIMLRQGLPAFEKIREKYGYDAQDYLAHDRVKVYMLRDSLEVKSGGKRRTNVRKLCDAPISPTLGIEVASFDETIDEMNAMQEAIYYSHPAGDA